MATRFVRVRRLSTSAPGSLLFNVPQQSIVVGKQKKTLVRDFKLEIREGEKWAIVGPNGCGKSTTARLIGQSYCQQPVDGDVVDAHIAFESHRILLQDELREYRESRSDVTKLRATLASYLFPHLAPENAQFRGTSRDGTAVGYRPKPTRLAPLAVPYDAAADDPLLADLEHAIKSDDAGRLLEAFGMRDVRHRPVFAMSTGEARKMLIMSGLLTPPRLWVLDETFDGLDEVSRGALRDELDQIDGSPEWAQRALVLITHHGEEILPSGGDKQVLAPTHGLLLGQGEDGTGYEAGEWDTIAPKLEAYFVAQQERQWVKPPPRPKPRAEGARPSSDAERAPLVDFKSVTVQYNQHVVFDQLKWMVREGEKWVVLGGNGTGKSTLVELITGDNVLGYQQDLELFGRRKGSGESIWEIKAQLGVLSTEFHMAYIDYADPSVRTAFRKPEAVTTWEVVCSGFFDSMGLYSEVSFEQEQRARDWVDRFELHDLITPPPKAPSSRGGAPPSAHGYRTAAAAEKAGMQNFFHLSHGQQKLVLLCRAMVKPPRLLLLDEPTHGLSGVNKERLLHTLSLLSDADDVAVVYVTHRQEEIDALRFDHVLSLGASSSRRN